MGYIGFGATDNTVVDSGGSGKVPSVEFQSVTGVPTNTETTVLSFTNTGAELFIDAIGGEGTARGEWFIYLNTILKAKRRSGVGVMNIDILEFGQVIANAGIIDVKVKHYETATQDFSSEVRFSR